MDSGGARVLSPSFLSKIASRRERIAHEWYLAISSASSLTSDRAGSILQFSELANRMIAFLTAPTQSEQEARDIGKSLADLHCVYAGVIETTWKLWIRHLIDLAQAPEMAVLYPRLVTLMYALTSGYFARSRETILSEQEQIRHALVFHVQKVSEQLRAYQLHLEEILEERTRELHAKEEHYRLITETSMLGIYQLDSSGSFTFLNDAFCNIVGYSREELLGRSIRMLFAPDHLSTVDSLSGTLHAVDALTTEFRLKHKDGRSVDTTIRVVRLQINEQEVFTGFVADVTDQKRMQEALRQSEVTLRALIDNTPDTIWSIDTKYRLTSTNAPFREGIAAFVGREALSGESVFTGIPQVLVDEWAPLYARALAGEAFTQAGISPGGLRGSLYRETSFNPILNEHNKVVGVACFSRDTTERVRREEALRTSEQRLHTIYSTVSDVIFLVEVERDEQYRFVSVNPAFCTVTGWSREDVVGKTVNEIIPGPNLSSVLGRFQQAIEGKTAVRWEATSEYPRGRLTGEMNVAPLFDDNGRCTHLVGSVHDITARKQVEETLRQSEERYRTLAESARDLILTVNREHAITYANSFAGNYLAPNSDEVTGQASTLFFGSKSGEALDAAIDSVFHSGNDLRLEELLEFKSHFAWFSLSLVPLKDTLGNVASVFILAKDISDLKKSEQALLRAKTELEGRVRERTASLAASQKRSRDLARQVITAQEEERRRLARELHDQSGQALISIKYEMDTIFKDVHADSKPAHKRISKMMASIDQAVRQIREISQNLRPPILDIAGINLSLEEYCTELSKKTSLAIKYRGSELPRLDAEIGITLFRIVQELLTNILKHAHATTATISLSRQDDVIVLVVEDNGKGMKSESSKAGFGLLGVQERLDILGGSLATTSRNGRGTKITVSIPWKDLED